MGIEVLDHALFIKLEPRIAERAVLVEARCGAGERRRPFDASFGQEVSDFDEISRCPCKACGQRFDVDLVTPLHPPLTSTRITNRDAGP